MAASQMPRMTPETSWFYVGQRDSHPTTIPTSQSPFHVFSVHASPMATSFPERYTSPYPDQTVEMMPSVQRPYTFLWSTFCSDGSFRFAAVELSLWWPVHSDGASYFPKLLCQYVHISTPPPAQVPPLFLFPTTRGIQPRLLSGAALALSTPGSSVYPSTSRHPMASRAAKANSTTTGSHTAASISSFCKSSFFRIESNTCLVLYRFGSAASPTLGRRSLPSQMHPTQDAPKRSRRIERCLTHTTRSSAPRN